ncbi:MAG: CHAT domain-containing tetratricopeptide repeat protein [Pseudomonadota bacterium]
MRIILTLAFICMTSSAIAQTMADRNQAAVAAFTSGDTTKALELTLDVIEAGAIAGLAEPEAYLMALNNRTFMALQGVAPGVDPVRAAADAVDFARQSKATRSANGVLSFANQARVRSLAGDRTGARISRAQMLANVGPNELSVTLGAAVDLAFLNEDYGDLAPLISDMLDRTGQYSAQLVIGTIYERQAELEQAGDADAVSDLIDASLVITEFIAPDLLLAATKNGLWKKYFMQYEAENFSAASIALTAWANAGERDSEEVEAMAEVAQDALTLAQGQYYAGDPEKLLGFAELALAYARVAYDPEDHRIGLALRELASAQSTLGDYAAAETTLQTALGVLNLSPAGPKHAFLVIEDLANNASNRSALDQASALHIQADKAYAAALDAGATPVSSMDRSILADNRVRLELDRGELAAAREQFEIAKSQYAVFLQSGAAKKNDTRHEVLLLEAESLLLAAEGEFAASADAAIRAAELAEERYPPDLPRLALTLHNIADTLMVVGELETGAAYFDKAAAVAEEVMLTDNPLRVGINFKQALISLIHGRRDDAIAQFRSVAEGRKSPRYRTSLRENASNFEVFAWTLLGQSNPSLSDINDAVEALQWTHVSRSSDALQMTETRLAAANPADAELLKARQDAALAFERSRETLSKAYAEDRPVADLLTRQRRLLSDLQTADAAIADAGLNTVGLGPVSPLSITEIQTRLRPNEVLVTFLLPGLVPNQFPGVDQSSNHVLAIRKDRVVVGLIPEAERGALNAKIAAFRCEMALSEEGCDVPVLDRIRGTMLDEDPTEAEFDFDLDLAHALYVDLFGGVADAIEGKDHLIIVPPSDLLRLPFQALVTDAADGDAPADVPWLIRSHAISVLPSIPALKFLRDGAADTETTAAVFGIGDPVIGEGPDINCATYEVAALRSAAFSTELYSSVSDNGLRLANPAVLRALDRLPDASCELRAIERNFDGGKSTLMLRADASETNLKALNASGDLAEYGVLVFATHGLTNGEASAVAPGLVLTPPERATELDDGLLTSAEVATLDLNARLVILSACNTAAGEDAAAEGMSGLASAFFHAGARGLMVTHWAVYSSASAEVSVGVATAVAADGQLGNAAALQKAVLNILDDPSRPAFHYHPAYWAPFTIVGL